jgi:radical SAM protein with 4Fe4S-binding SPASM domain
MTEPDSGEWICRAHCVYYKPARAEEDRCRGFTLACGLVGHDESASRHSSIPPFSPSYKRTFLREHVCGDCPFLIDGCDFTSPNPPQGCLPCGGLIVLSGWLQNGVITEDQIERGGAPESCAGSYVTLTRNSAIKLLEEDCVYHIGRDELYEVNKEALEFLLKCDGSRRIEELAPDPEFLRFCLEEDILQLSDLPAKAIIEASRSPVPSLRYLEWLVTFRCNLECTHCYLGDSEPADFPPELIRPLLSQFSAMQGLRVLVSGGEPTVYPHFEAVNAALPDYPLRAVLLTNGIALTEKMAAKLNFHEVQVSLDGLEAGHDMLRGKGTFRKTLEGARAVRAAGKDLSVATMIHQGNLNEWDQLRDLALELGAREWSIDYPCAAGRLPGHPQLAVPLDVAAEKMAYGFGGSYHGSSEGWTCGRRLAAVLPSGRVCRCGLLQGEILGSVEEGLALAWARVDHIPIGATECAECAHAAECGGGCRFRAGGRGARDLFMCKVYGVG